ncbi:hypothetical protein E4U42_004488 [Claviceps africana]|uniref:Uncharacterized protein n=1 Tax=Claviceps africana TaxID=83212 RepID=A0A8K0NG56_9HYPO|nr:hypothetical protein E4U42_004488 [Claviceps africana]
MGGERDAAAPVPPDASWPVRQSLQSRPGIQGSQGTEAAGNDADASKANVVHAGGTSDLAAEDLAAEDLAAEDLAAEDLAEGPGQASVPPPRPRFTTVLA